MRRLSRSLSILLLAGFFLFPHYIAAADPGFAGFYPLRYYPCDSSHLEDPEFHPLRPYPASPCDPLIPRKIPEAPLSPSKEFLTFSCDNSLNLSGTYTVLDFVPTEVTGSFNECTADLEDSNGATTAYQNYYECGGNICLVHQVIFDFNVDLSATRLPIIGNTEFPTSDTVLTNSYLDWYLNGSVLHSEHRALNPDNPFDQRRITTFTGPLLKQLPLDIQHDIRNTLSSSPPVHDQIHNYIVSDNILFPTRLTAAGANLYKYMPLATLEDTTSEVTVGLIPGDQPPSDGSIIRTCPDRPFEIALGDSVNGGQSDSRIYAPHMRGDDALSDLLASLSRPYPTGTVDSTDTDLFSRTITQHQGIDDSTPIQRYDYHTGTNIRNTEVGDAMSVTYPSRYLAPDPITATAPDALCEQPIALSNYGDRVMGKDFNSTLIYYQRFEYSPAYRGTITGCSIEGGTCRDDDDCCAYNAGYSAGGCRGYRPGNCHGPAPVCRTLPNQSSCQAFSWQGCSWDPERLGHCRPWPRTELTSAARVNVFTKTPLIERIYDTLVVGGQSVIRRFLPKKPAAWPSSEYLKGETNLENALPGASVTTYTGQTSDLFSVLVSGGDGNLPVDIYYDRLGSLSDHFLGDQTEEKANLQKLLRPYVSPTPTP